MTALVVGCCFVIAMFFSPLFLSIPSAATAPALIIVGLLMAEQINWFVLFFYILNAAMVTADLVLYARNYKLDQQRKEENHVS